MKSTNMKTKTITFRDHHYNILESKGFHVIWRLSLSYPDNGIAVKPKVGYILDCKFKKHQLN